MTNKEAFCIMVSCPVDSKAIDLALLNIGVNGEQEYDPMDASTLEKGMVDILYGFYMLNSQSEGDASLSYNFNGIKERLLYLAKKYGRNDVLDSLSPAVISNPIW